MSHSHWGFGVIKLTALKYFLARCPLTFYPGSGFRLDHLRRFWFSGGGRPGASLVPKNKFLFSRGEEVANPSAVAPGWMSSLLPAAAVPSISPSPSPQDAIGLTVGPETVVTGDQQTSEPVARFTYTYSGHELMKCTHCLGLLANTCALVCTRTHSCTQRRTDKHAASLSST